MDTAIIVRLLEPFVRLDQRQLDLISIYIDLLLKWNARINLTSVRNPEEIVTRHFGESFFAGEILRSQQPVHRGIDLGSGAGFPGIPVAILLPDAQLILIESNHKKVTFLKEVIFALSLKNVSTFSGRAETFPGRADLVTMRAVERFEAALPTTVRLLEPGGRIALMIGASQVSAAKAVAQEVEWNPPVQVPSGQSRILLVGTRGVKVG